MSRKRHIHVDTFPFLAVLLCAMGSLILLLLAFDRRAKVVARAKAAEYAAEAAAKKAKAGTVDQQEWERKVRQLHELLVQQQLDLQNQLRAILGTKAATVQRLKNEELAVISLHKAIGEQKSDLDRKRNELAIRRGVLATASAQEKGAQKELERFARELDQLERTLHDLQAVKRRDKETYSLVPYHGKHGSNRKPIYVECAGYSLVFHPGERSLSPLSMTPAEFLSEVVRLGGKIPRKSDADREPDSAYVLFLVRPSGIATYYQAQAVMKELGMDYGYEFVEADWVFDFGGEGNVSPQPWQTAGTGAKSGPPRFGPVALGTGPGGSGTGQGGPGTGTGVGPGNSGPWGGQVGNGSGISGPGTGQGTGTGNGTGWPNGAGSGNQGSQGIGVGLPGTGQGTGIGIWSGPGGSGGGSGIPGTGIPGTGSGNGWPTKGSSGVPGQGSGTGTVGSGIPGTGTGTGWPNVAGTGSGNGSGIPGAGQGTGSSNGGGSGIPGTGQGSASGIPGSGQGTGWPNGGGQGNGQAVANGNVVALGQGPIPGGQGGTGSNAPGGGSGAPGSSNAGPWQPSSGVPGNSSTAGGQNTSVPGNPLPVPSASNNGGQNQPDDADLERQRRLYQPGGGGNSGGGNGQAIPLGQASPLANFQKPEKISTRPNIPLGRLIGNRDFILVLECTADAVIIQPWGTRFPLTTLPRVPDSSHALVGTVQQLINRRQATVQKGETPYRPILRFKIQPDGLRAYYLAYPLLEGLRLPMLRENVDSQ